MRLARGRTTALLAALVALALPAVPTPTRAYADASAPEQTLNGDFAQGMLGWSAYGATSSGIAGGALCAVVPGGLANYWDAGIVQNLPLELGATYALSFHTSATLPVTIRLAVQLGAAPFTAALDQIVTVPAEPADFGYTFTSNVDTANGQLAFQLGTSSVDYTFCLDDVSLAGGTAQPPYQPDTGPRVRVNQVGYLPGGPKNATVVTDATDPLPWQLRTAAGSTVATGIAAPRGVDEASGQNVQTIDFSGYTVPGNGYVLVADEQTSYPFDISGEVYRQLRSDSLQFFYLQRSGIAVDGRLVGPEYARPAGHLGAAPNQGDTDVPCQPGVCDYRLDVHGGWYDAGDQGKYPINGIATYQLLNMLERTSTAVTGGFGAALGDSTLRVPERGNQVPDVLDEARWELEFLIRMQVPAGQPLAGMVHHKVHDNIWTDLPLLPQNDPQPRELHAPSTAATLDLAAVGAQCARVFAPYDPAFAASCMRAARTAYAAAKAHPALYATEADGVGGGTYVDNDASDEFYWAAAELYLTTGEQRFLTDLTGSPQHTADVFDPTGFGWLHTAALGRLDLATVPSRLPTSDRNQVRRSVLTAADSYLDLLRGQGYGLALPGAPWAYFWGSNSNIINNAVVLAVAYDLTGDVKYRDGALQGMDYIFGRNALNQSYVTGWGEKSTQNQHSRMYAHELDPSLPRPPAGSLTGGANTSMNDPFAARLLAGCKPQFCYVDDIQSPTTNEVAINYNSALAWMASFVADQGAGAAPAAGACRVRYTNVGLRPDGTAFTVRVEVTNNGRAPVDGWALRFAFVGDQRVREAWQGREIQSGAVVTLRNESDNARIRPGATVAVGFNATTAGGANPAPGLFTLNGAACTTG